MAWLCGSRGETLWISVVIHSWLLLVSVSLFPMDRARKTELRADWLDVPKPDRFSKDRVDFAKSMAAHHKASVDDDPGYPDPTTGLFVMTATYLRDRGWCCDRGCRHCPYED